MNDMLRNYSPSLAVRRERDRLLGKVHSHAEAIDLIAKLQVKQEALAWIGGASANLFGALNALLSALDDEEAEKQREEDEAEGKP